MDVLLQIGDGALLFLDHRAYQVADRQHADDTLVIEGELRFNVPEGAKAIWQEFGPSKFRRSLRLGAAVDPSRVEAIYRNGMLLVTMPKAEHAKPRQIPVQIAANGPATPSNN